MTFQGNSDHLKMLLRSIHERNPEIWNEWKVKTEQMIDLKGINLSWSHLDNYNFSNVNFKSANFSHCSLFHTEFNNSILEDADFTDSNKTTKGESLLNYTTS